MNRSRVCALRRGALTACAAMLLIAAGAPAAQKEDQVTLRFDPVEGRELRYEGSSRNQMFWSGMDMIFNTGQSVEMVFGQELGDTAVQLELKFVKCTSSMVRAGNLQEWTSPIKAEGRTLRVSVDGRGKVIDVLGAIPGLSKGRQTRQYVEKWFFELPAEPVGKGSAWTVEIDEQSAEEDDDKYSITGTAEFVLKKFGKKHGLAVAEIEGKAVTAISTMQAQGMFEGKAEFKIKAAVAVEGGHVVELTRNVETKGKLAEEDPVTGKVQERDVVRIDWDEVKLAK